MRRIIFYQIFLFSNFLISQNLSYGPLIGGDFYTSNNNNSSNQFTSHSNSFSTNIGGYLEYNFNNNVGIKTDLTLNNKQMDYNNSINFKLGFVDISPNIKYNFGNEYRKGFYMLLGSRFSFLTKAKVEGNDAKDIFKKTNIGLQIGLGQRISNFIDIQGKFDYGITPFFKNNNNDQSKFFGAYFSLNIDIEKIINKQ